MQLPGSGKPGAATGTASQAEVWRRGRKAHGQSQSWKKLQATSRPAWETDKAKPCLIFLCRVFGSSCWLVRLFVGGIGNKNLLGGIQDDLMQEKEEMSKSGCKGRLVQLLFLWIVILWCSWDSKSRFFSWSAWQLCVSLSEVLGLLWLRPPGSQTRVCSIVESFSSLKTSTADCWDCSDGAQTSHRWAGRGRVWAQSSGSHNHLTLTQPNPNLT